MLFNTPPHSWEITSVPASLADEMMASSYKRYIPVPKWIGIVKLQTKQDCCSVAAKTPPQGISSRARERFHLFQPVWLIRWEEERLAREAQKPR